MISPYALRRQMHKRGGKISTIIVMTNILRPRDSSSRFTGSSPMGSDRHDNNHDFFWNYSY
jgi:hypothetical protein